MLHCFIKRDRALICCRSELFNCNSPDSSSWGVYNSQKRDIVVAVQQGLQVTENISDLPSVEETLATGDSDRDTHFGKDVLEL